MNPPYPSVLICGAGPVGLTLAVQLLHQGVPFRIIDRHSGRTTLSKALVVWARSLEQLDSALPTDRLVLTGLPVQRSVFCVGNRELARIELEGTHSPYGAGVMIAQADTEKCIEDHLATQGTKVEWQTELLDFSQDGDGVNCQLQTPTGSTETLKAHWLVGCDGAHSIVRHRLGLPFEGEQELHRWLLADVRVKGRLPDATIVLFWHRNGPLILFRMKDERWRIVATCGFAQAEEPRTEPSLEQMQALIDERGPGGIQLYDPIWRAEFHINERQVKHYRVGRAYLAGDAAHVHSPAGGQGMNTGIQDACNLAWKLALEHRGLAGETLLDSYHDERFPIGAQVVRGTARMARLPQQSICAAVAERVATPAAASGPDSQKTQRVTDRTRCRLPGQPGQWPLGTERLRHSAGVKATGRHAAGSGRKDDPTPCAAAGSDVPRAGLGFGTGRRRAAGQSRPRAVAPIAASDRLAAGDGQRQ
jgi:2-polyprenyl-6-methoxyphenol hydroxylase-like FAD-dependent oxidoreductase